MSANINLSKTQISKIVQLAGFVGRLLGPLIKFFLPSMKKVIKPSARSVLIPLGLTAADANIQTKIFWSGMTSLIISNETMECMIKIVTALEDYDLLIRSTIETIENEAKEQKGGFLIMLLGTLGASLLANLLAGEDVHVDDRIIWAGKVTIRAGWDF